MTNEIADKSRKAALASKKLGLISPDIKNAALKKMAVELQKNCGIIFSENNKDVHNAIKKNISKALIDRLTINEKRLSSTIYQTL